MTYENQFKSVFSKDIVAFLNERQLLKMKTEDLFYQLRTFDRMCFELHVEENIITKELVKKWMKKRPNESINNQSSRAIIIRAFGKYMYRNNINNYIVPTNIYTKKINHTTHIYTRDEIKKFFRVIDNLKPSKHNDFQPKAMPIIYRILLFTGIRINEVLSLKIKDVIFDQKLLVVFNAKNDNERLVPISDELCDLLFIYKKEINKNRNDDDYFFRNSWDNKINIHTFYHHFRKYLWEARIPHTGKGPRVHDFRHTYAVNCIQKWLTEEKNIKVFLPYLQTYLGHSCVESTYYYYHLTLEIYPYLEKKIFRNNNIIPIIKDGDIHE